MTRNDNTMGVMTLSPLIGRRAAREVLRHYGISDILHLDRQSLLRMRHIGPRRAEAILALPKLIQQLVYENQ